MGVVQPRDYGYVVVTWSNLSMYDHCWSPYDVPLDDYETMYVISMVDIVLWDNICYASTVVLRPYDFSYFGITPMIHVMNLSMHNALSTLSWGAWHYQV
jgi:hypothetical protein